MREAGSAQDVGGHGRRHRHRRTTGGGADVYGASPVAAARTSASVGRRSSGSNDWAGLRAATVTPGGRAGDRRTAAPTQVLPTSVPVPAQTTSIGQRVGEAPCDQTSGDLVVGVGGGQGDPQPGASRARRSAGGWRARAGRARRAGWPTAPRRALLVAEDDRHDRRRVPGRPAGRRAPAGGRPGASPSAERSDRRAASAAAVSAGRRRGGEDERAGRVDDRSTNGTRSGDEPAERAERLGQGADPQHVESGRWRVQGGPSTAWASSTTSSAPCSTQTRPQLVEGGDVAVHREHRVGDDDGRPARGRRGARRHGRRRRGG